MSLGRRSSQFVEARDVAGLAPAPRFAALLAGSVSCAGARHGGSAGGGGLVGPDRDSGSLRLHVVLNTALLGVLLGVAGLVVSSIFACAPICRSHVFLTNALLRYSSSHRVCLNCPADALCLSGTVSRSDTASATMPAWLPQAA